MLPRWRAGIEAVVATPKVRDAYWFGLYTGMRLNEVLSLQRMDMAGLVFRVEETKTGEPLLAHPRTPQPGERNATHCWRAGIEAVVATPKVRDAFWFGLYTGMRLNEVLSLRWERMDMAGLVFRVEETKTGEPLELPITRQLAAILERRNRESETLGRSSRLGVPVLSQSRPHL